MVIEGVKKRKVCLELTNQLRGELDFLKFRFGQSLMSDGEFLRWLINRIYLNLINQ